MSGDTVPPPPPIPDLPSTSESAEQLSTRISEACASTILVNVIYMADKLDIFRHLFELEGNATACAVAAACGFRERYVVEPLRSLAASRLVSFDVARSLCSLTPAGKAIFLDRLSPFHATGGVLTEHTVDDVVACFPPSTAHTPVSPSTRSAPTSSRAFAE
ncbi:hypothetical protein PYCC9005_005317 [Savitreella phatthalungensis]